VLQSLHAWAATGIQSSPISWCTTGTDPRPSAPAVSSPIATRCLLLATGTRLGGRPACGHWSTHRSLGSRGLRGRGSLLRSFSVVVVCVPLARPSQSNAPDRLLALSTACAIMLLKFLVQLQRSFRYLGQFRSYHSHLQIHRCSVGPQDVRVGGLEHYSPWFVVRQPERCSSAGALAMDPLKKSESWREKCSVHKRLPTTHLVFLHPPPSLLSFLRRTYSVRDLLEGFSRASSYRGIYTEFFSASTRSHSSQWASR
jgi:hypothetical protein